MAERAARDRLRPARPTGSQTAPRTEAAIIALQSEDFPSRNSVCAVFPGGGVEAEQFEQGPDEITLLLRQWTVGDRGALDRLIPKVEHELRRLAGRLMRSESEEHTLQTTALVNEAYLRLVRQDRAEWQNRAHFFAVAARIMRRILVDHARRKAATKRGGGVPSPPVSEALTDGEATPESLLALHDALRQLETLCPRQSQIVELKHFGGLSNREIAHVLTVSIATVKRDWLMARTWLYRALTHAETAI